MFIFLYSCSKNKDANLLKESDLKLNGQERLSSLPTNKKHWKSYIHWYCFPSSKLRIETYLSEGKEYPVIKVQFHHTSFNISCYSDIPIDTKKIITHWKNIIDYENNGETCFYMTQIYSESAAKEYSFDFYVEKIKSLKGSWELEED